MRDGGIVGMRPLLTVARSRLSAVACLLVAVLTCPVPTAAAGKHRTISRIVMKPPTPQGAGSVQIDGGSRQDPNHWQATLRFLAGKSLICTSTIVGQRVVLTAAHCIRDGAMYSIDLGPAGKYDLKCEKNPKYVRRTLQGDVALCYSGASLPNSGGFENLYVDLPIAIGTKLFLLGYGCRSVIRLDGSGQLYGGSSKVLKLPSANDDHLLTKGGVVICPGDSGGAAYLLAVADHPVTPRSIVGVNSSFDVSDRSSGITTFSGSTLQFLFDWKKAKGTTICGLDLDAEGCHDRFIP